MSKKNMHGVYCLKPIKNTNTAIIKCVGIVEDNVAIADEELMTGNKHSYTLSDTVFVKFYKCNLMDSFIITTRTLPFLYASILYQNELTGGSLFKIYIDFRIESDVKSEKELINNTLNGKYSIRIKTDDNEKIIELDKYDGNASMIETLKLLVQTDEMRDIISNLMEERRKERIALLGSMEDIEIPKVTYNFNDLVKKYKKDGTI